MKCRFSFTVVNSTRHITTRPVTRESQLHECDKLWFGSQVVRHSIGDLSVTNRMAFNSVQLSLTVVPSTAMDKLLTHTRLSKQHHWYQQTGWWRSEARKVTSGVALCYLCKTKFMLHWKSEDSKSHKRETSILPIVQWKDNDQAVPVINCNLINCNDSVFYTHNQLQLTESANSDGNQLRDIARLLF